MRSFKVTDEEANTSASSRDSSVLLTSSRGRPRWVPSYTENNPDSADDFEEPDPVVEAPILSRAVPASSPRKKNTPKKRTSKTRNLFEESKDEEAVIDDASSFEESHEEENTFSSLRNGESRSAIFRATPKKATRVAENKPSAPESDNEFDIADDSPQELPTQSSKTQISAISSDSNPFRNILIQMRNKMTAPKQLTDFLSDDESSGDDFASFDMTGPPTKQPVEVRSAGSSSANSSIDASEGSLEIHESFVALSPNRKAQTYSHQQRTSSAKNINVWHNQNLVSTVVDDELLEHFSDSEGSEFGAFKNVVKDVMMNTSRLSQSKERMSDTDSSAF